MIHTIRSRDTHYSVRMMSLHAWWAQVPPLDPEQVCPEGSVYQRGDSGTDVEWDTIGGGVESVGTEIGDKVGDAAEGVGDAA